MSKLKTLLRSKSVVVRLTPEEYATLQRLAAREGRSISNLVRYRLGLHELRSAPHEDPGLEL